MRKEDPYEAIGDASVSQRLRATEERMHEIEGRLAAQLAARADPTNAVPNVNQQHQESFSRMDRIALAITTRVGTFGFFLVIFTWTLFWLGWNTLAPRSIRFDPAPAFVLWLFISNMIQIFLMPLIMVGQNLLGRHAELRAEGDFQINQKAEREVETILLSLERQAAIIERQGELILYILRCVDQSASRPTDQT